MNENPEIFKSATAAYTLSYALIMLQTSLHNPSVQEKDRMKISDFTHLIKKINDGEDLEAELIKNIYLDIQKNQLALHQKEAAKKAF